MAFGPPRSGNRARIGDARASEGLTHVGGYIGLATAVAAWYASFAAVTNTTFGRIVMPVRPLRRPQT